MVDIRVREYQSKSIQTFRSSSSCLFRIRLVYNSAFSFSSDFINRITSAVCNVNGNMSGIQHVLDVSVRSVCVCT